MLYFYFAILVHMHWSPNPPGPYIYQTGSRRKPRSKQIYQITLKPAILPILEQFEFFPDFCLSLNPV